MRRRPIVSRSDVVNGTHFKPPNNIRTVAARPWNNYTVQFSLPHTDDKLVTIADVRGRTNLTNGLQTDNSIDIRIEVKIRSVEIYGISNQTLTVLYYEIGPSPRWEQANQCFPAKNQFARVGFSWPLTDQSVPYNATDDESQVLRLRGTASTGDVALLKFRILWRSIQYNSATTQFHLESPSRPLALTPAVQDSSSVNDDLKQAIEELSSILRDKLIIAS
jgi:hypothetical protein